MTANMTEAAAEIVAATYDDLSTEEVELLGRERGASAALPLLRGTYTFRLPKITADSFKPVTRRIFEDGVDTGKKTEYFEISRENFKLIIEDGPEGVGTEFPWRLSAVPRKMRLGFGPTARQVFTSDANLVVASAFKMPSPKTPTELKAALIKCSGGQMKARLVYAGQCNKARDAFFFSPALNKAVPVAYSTAEDGTPLNIQGCGSRVWNSGFRANPQAEDEASQKGVYATCQGYQPPVIIDGTRYAYTNSAESPWQEVTEATDEGRWLCKARIRAFAELEGFSPAGK